jgi:multidrug resistance efflux pump
VTAVNITAGDNVTSGTMALEISDLSLLRMTVAINELDIDLVTEGLPATIQLDALTEVEIPGTVEHVGWIAGTSDDGIVTYAVQVVLNTDDTRVRLGMTGEVTIETGSTTS